MSISLSEVKKLHTLICKPKPKYHFCLINAQIDNERESLDDKDKALEEKQSKDMYVYLVV